MGSSVSMHVCPLLRQNFESHTAPDTARCSFPACQESTQYCGCCQFRTSLKRGRRGESISHGEHTEETHTVLLWPPENTVTRAETLLFNQASYETIIYGNEPSHLGFAVPINPRSHNSNHRVRYNWRPRCVWPWCSTWILSAMVIDPYFSVLGPFVRRHDAAGIRSNRLCCLHQHFSKPRSQFSRDD